ncbi:MAG: hypothetical protein KDB00_16575 [Planctomycetales bacterium]|nr:hypothetical protein [Planctomycetales bacterium]
MPKQKTHSWLFRVGAMVAMCLTIALAPTADACNIPVFRYALERWKPDSCEVIVFYENELSPEQDALVDQLNACTSGQGGHANARLFRVNTDRNAKTDSSAKSDAANSDADSEHADLWSDLRQDSGVSLPHVLVRTKLGQGRFINHWNGSLVEATPSKLFQSPARTEIRSRLLAGHSVVWLLIRSGDREKSENAKKQAEETFKTLASKVQLPEGIGLPGSELYAEVPLVVKFSLLEIDADDPNEAFVSELLTGLRLSDYEAGEPLLVPVFGRGRALEVIPARDLSPRLMEELTMFLSGACSCQVKEQNPGFDLLIDADWDGQLFGDEENRPPDRSAEEGQNRNPVLVPIPAGRK